LDEGETPLPDALEDSEIAAVAEDALAELPERARRLLANVPILILDLPARQDVAEGLDPRLLGLFQGTPLPETSTLGGGANLTQIMLFKRNLERFAEDPGELREEIRTTLLHETGHFFGMSESDLAKVGLD
jgi:predicted Zn-dependent protease with MMP-like domain